MAAFISSSLGERVLVSGLLPIRLWWLTNPKRDVSGACPYDVGPPTCYVGATWTPNDPLFFMHHAVRVTSVPRSTTSPSFHYIVVSQMIDKVWHDWQKKSPKNKYAYGGGSITALPHYKNFTEFPTGMPPNTNVSV